MFDSKWRVEVQSPKKIGESIKLKFKLCETLNCWGKNKLNAKHCFSILSNSTHIHILPSVGSRLEVSRNWKGLHFWNSGIKKYYSQPTTTTKALFPAQSNFVVAPFTYSYCPQNQRLQNVACCPPPLKFSTWWLLKSSELNATLFWGEPKIAFACPKHYFFAPSHHLPAFHLYIQFSCPCFTLCVCKWTDSSLYLICCAEHYWGKNMDKLCMYGPAFLIRETKIIQDSQFFLFI